MEVSFIGQGFEPESRNAVGNILKTKLEDNRYSHIFIISAFASSFTMDFLHDKIQSNSIWNKLQKRRLGRGGKE